MVIVFIVSNVIIVLLFQVQPFLLPQISSSFDLLSTSYLYRRHQVAKSKSLFVARALDRSLRNILKIFYLPDPGLESLRV